MLFDRPEPFLTEEFRTFLKVLNSVSALTRAVLDRYRLKTQMKLFFQAASPAHQKKEKNKARELKASSWWKQQIGRGICYHCEQKFSLSDLTMDHLIPIARGGKSDKKNCVVSCKSCNTKKGHKTRAELALDGLEGQNNSIFPDSDEDSSN